MNLLHHATYKFLLLIIGLDIYRERKFIYMNYIVSRQFAYRNDTYLSTILYGKIITQLYDIIKYLFYCYLRMIGK